MKTILIVEDDKNELESLQTAIENAGFQVLTAPDGAIALSTLAASSVDLVILDIVMPHVNGLQVLEMIRKNPKTISLPVIMLTNLDADDESLKRIIRDQPAYYFIKSNIKLDVLVDKIKSVLGMETQIS